MSKQRGLTLIELMITLAVLAVLATSAVPAMTRFIDEQRLTAGANLLVTHLQYARSEAIARNLPVSACPSPDGLTCQGNRWDMGWMVFIDRHKSAQPASPQEVLRVVQPETALQMSSGGRKWVRFQGSGAAYGSNLTIRVCAPRSDSSARAVIVSNPGRVRAERNADPTDCAES